MNENQINKITNSEISDCQIIQDLLPLYCDGVCSESSRCLIDEHLKFCKKCNQMKDELSNTAVENHLSAEIADVLQTHQNKERRKSATIGMIISSVLMIPVIVCLICNIATGHALNWFFIVLTSLIVTASITIVPLMVTEKRKMWTVLAFTFSVLLLLFTVSVYSGGKWFVLSAVSTFFGLCVFTLPFICDEIPFPKMLQNKKGVLIMLWNTIWLYILLYVCLNYAGKLESLCLSYKICTVSLVFPWLLFFVIRYTSFNRLIKSGVCLILCGIMFPFLNDIINNLIYGTIFWSLPHANLSIWNDNYINPNCYLLIFLSFLSIGLILIITGVSHPRKD